jgi:hypothetical protein
LRLSDDFDQDGDDASLEEDSYDDHNLPSDDENTLEELCKQYVAVKDQNKSENI